MVEERKVKANDPAVVTAAAELTRAIMSHDRLALAYHNKGSIALKDYQKSCMELSMAHAKLAGISAANVMDMMIEEGVLKSHYKEK